MEKIFAVVGQDARQQAAAAALRRQGWRVVSADEVYQADYILLPLPLPTELASLLRAAKPGALALGGKISLEAMRYAAYTDIELLDYFTRPELEERNAIPTAEGALRILLENRRRTLWQSPVLVLGFGRVGRALALRLHALGAQVTVAARRAVQRAQAESFGMNAVELSGLAAILKGQDTVVNTVPAPVLGRQELEALPPDAFVLDLASQPGGVDKAAARELGVRVQHALSLPAQYAPDTAGAFVAQTVLDILRERGELV